MIIDVGYSQGTIKWAKVAKDKNIEGVIIECGYGQDIKSQDDARFKDNVAACIKYNIPFGLYIYSYAKTKAAVKGEANHILRLAKPIKDKLALPLFYDIEEAGTEKGCTERFAEWAKLIRAAGFEPGLYTGEYWFNTCINKDVGAYLWIAKYGTNNGKEQTKPKVKAPYQVWQYTSRAKVDGITGGVDANKVMDKSIFIDKNKKSDNKTVKGKVTASSGLNCRAKASTSTEVLGAFKCGTALDIVAKPSDAWYKVKGVGADGSNLTGYVSSKYVEILAN